MTDLSNLYNFLLESDFQTINEFIGEGLLKNNTKAQMNEDVRYFISKLAKAISTHKKETCRRKCFLRKREENK